MNVPTNVPTNTPHAKVFAGLSIEDLVGLIGHRDWKGFALGETLMLVAMQAIDEDGLRKKIEAHAKRAVTIAAKDEVAPGGVHLRMLTFSLAPEAR